MGEKRKKGEWPIVAVVVAPVLMLATYVAAYFMQTKGIDVDAFGEVGKTRWYDAQWKARVFYPATLMESLITRQEVKAYSL